MNNPFASKANPYLGSLKIGDIIKVIHGIGIVKGFENFDEKGNSLPLTDKIARKDHFWYGVEYGRVVVDLQEPNFWPWKGEDYYAYPSDILTLNQLEQ